MANTQTHHVSDSPTCNKLVTDNLSNASQHAFQQVSRWVWADICAIHHKGTCSNQLLKTHLHSRSITLPTWHLHVQHLQVRRWTCREKKSQSSHDKKGWLKNIGHANCSQIITEDITLDFHASISSLFRTLATSYLLLLYNFFNQCRHVWIFTSVQKQVIFTMIKNRQWLCHLITLTYVWALCSSDRHLWLTYDAVMLMIESGSFHTTKSGYKGWWLRVRFLSYN